ncbi:MAG: hypothetical protein JG767_789 [Deferribacteraceae bacterium]|jgi:hypothetical protein|nr:hypothetical protein [Deferribacteraceae bacterium]
MAKKNMSEREIMRLKAGTVIKKYRVSDRFADRSYIQKLELLYILLIL